MPAYDGALAVAAKPERFREECETARNLGFAGKSCIHPTQVPIANECFMPRPAEVEKGADASWRQPTRRRPRAWAPSWSTAR